MSKYLVTFGWEVEAEGIEEARLKAKKNLKPYKDRKPVEHYQARKLVEEMIVKRSIT